MFLKILENILIFAVKKVYIFLNLNLHLLHQYYKFDFYYLKIYIFQHDNLVKNNRYNHLNNFFLINYLLLFK